MLSKVVLHMGLLRLLSGVVELTAACLILRWNSIEKALALNSALAVIGPIVLMTATAIGLSGISDKLSWGKFLWVTAGVTCLMIGILKK